MKLRLAIKSIETYSEEKSGLYKVSWVPVSAIVENCHLIRLWKNILN